MEENQIAELLIELWRDVQQPAIIWQVGVLALCLFVAWLITRQVKAVLRRRRAADPTVADASEEGLRRVVFPLTALGLVVLARADAINAFAAGWSPEDSIIAVTQGALDYLTRDELQGLVAHELSHLKEGDTYLNMHLVGMVYGLELIYNFGAALRDEAGVLGRWFGSAIMAAGWIGWFSGKLLKAAVSRQREWLADARALQWTRNPAGLGGVLRKVLYQRQQAQRQRGSWHSDRRSYTGLNHPLVQHMLLAEVPDSGRLAHWLDAHPPLQARIAKVYGRAMPAMALQQDEQSP